MRKSPVSKFLVLLVLILGTSACASSSEETSNPIGSEEQTTTTPAGPEASVDVVWLSEDSRPIKYRDRTVDWGGFPQWTMTWRESKVTITFQDSCGDECALTRELVLRDRDGTPEFVSYDGQAIDYFDKWERHWEGHTGLLEIGRWDPDAQIISGRFWIGDPAAPALTFVFDDTDTGLFARHARNEAVSFDEIKAALGTDQDQVLDAYFVLESHEARYDLESLRQELLRLVDGGPTANADVAFGAVNLLGESLNDFTNIAYRQPVAAFQTDVGDPEQALQVRTNWELMIDASVWPTPTVYEDGVTPFVGLTVDEANAVAGVYASDSRCEADPEGCVFLSLQCNLVAVWNEGNELFSTRWTIADGSLVLLNSPPALDAFIGAEPSGDYRQPFEELTSIDGHYCG